MRTDNPFFKFLLLLSFPILILTSCRNNNEIQNNNSNHPNSSIYPLAAKGKAIFEGKGLCYSCHKTELKLIGPSLIDIAKIYKKKQARIALFLKGNQKPIVDPSQFEIMKVNFELTKNFTDEERLSLEQYILSQVRD